MKLSSYRRTNDSKWMFWMLQKTRYSTEEELPPPPSPPQLKEVSSLDGVPRPTSTERILADTVTQHVILRDGHQQVGSAACVGVTAPSVRVLLQFCSVGLQFASVAVCFSYLLASRNVQSISFLFFPFEMKVLLQRCVYITPEC
jgi:hypothetical protein